MCAYRCTGRQHATNIFMTHSSIAHLSITRPLLFLLLVFFFFFFFFFFFSPLPPHVPCYP
jgi:hypothetical protein